jgi:outer membrane protein TolC
MKSPAAFRAPVLLLAAAALLGGCTLAPSGGERQAQAEVTRVGDVLRAPDVVARPVPPADAPLADYVRYAVLRHPRVTAAYHDWRASVAAIAPQRALPDPQLTFEADISNMLMTLMPGLMFDVMTPGKRAAMAREAVASGTVAHRAFVAEVLGVAAGVRKAWIELAYADEALRLRGRTIASLDQAAAMASADYVTGRGMATLEVQVRLANETARVRSELEALEDRRAAARERFKASLGLVPGDADPAWPQATLAITALPPADELWRRAAAASPELGRMRAMVEMAVAGVDVARKAGTPDFTAGAMADLKANPLMVRPTATVTLPIWREKIRANIAAAEARRDAALARVSAEQLNLAAEIAQMLYMVRESDRMIGYIDRQALPSYERAIATVEAGYQSGMSSPGMIAETRVMAVGMQLERLAALRDRENAATDLLLMTATLTPPDLRLPLGADSVE